MDVSIGIIGGADGPTNIFLSTRSSWFSPCGLILMVLIMVPNIIYALREKDAKNLCTSRIMNLAEQVGRYGCMFFMVFPGLAGYFGTTSSGALPVYYAGNALLLAAYLIIWFFYLRKKQLWSAMCLALLPAGIFLLSGLMLCSAGLMVFAPIFAFAHPCVTWINAVRARKG